MTLNLKDPEGPRGVQAPGRTGRRRGREFPPRREGQLGIDYESLRKINPRIVYGSISGFGQDGPYHKRPGFDQIAQGMGGLMSITGAPGEGPMRVGIPVADLTAGLFCAIGILTALLERDVSGEGQWVQTSLLQAQIFMLDFQAARWLMEKEVAKQAGNNHPTCDPDRRVQDLRRLHQHRHHGRADLGALRAGDRRARACHQSRLRHRARALEEPRRAECRDRQAHREEIHARPGSRN